MGSNQPWDISQLPCLCDTYEMNCLLSISCFDHSMIVPTFPLQWSFLKKELSSTACSAGVYSPPWPWLCPSHAMSTCKTWLHFHFLFSFYKECFLIWKPEWQRKRFPVTVFTADITAAVLIWASLLSGAWNSIWSTMWIAGAKGLWSHSSGFSETLAGSWIRSAMLRAHTGICFVMSALWSVITHSATILVSKSKFWKFCLLRYQTKGLVAGFMQNEFTSQSLKRWCQVQYFKIDII